MGGKDRAISGTKPTIRGKTQTPLPHGLRWRGTVIAVVISLGASLVCLGLLGTLVKQVTLMIPGSTTPQERRAIEAAHRVWQSDSKINHTVVLLEILAQRDPTESEIARLADAVQDNSLPIWAELLVMLRKQGVGPQSEPVSQSADDLASQPVAEPVAVASRPAMDEGIASALNRLEYAPPLRIAMGSLHATYLAAAADRGVSARRAEAAFWPERWGVALAAYRSVLRELSGRLLALGRAEQRADRPAEAIRVYRAGIRALTDVADDSPLPEVALLVAAELQPFLADLASLQGGAQALRASEKLRAFQRAWIDVPDRELALLPCVFGPALVPQEHRQVLSSLTAGAGLLLCGWLLAVLCLILLIIVGATRPFGAVPLVWRWNGAAAVVAPAVVAAPAVVVVLLLASDAMPFIWLTSSRSIGAMVLAPAVMLLTWMTATHTFLRPTGDFQRATLPLWAIGAGLALVLVVAVGFGLVRPLHHDAWSPPAGIQLFRRISTLAGLTSLIVLAAGAAWGWRRRRQNGLPAGVLSRAGLAVAGGAMAILLTGAAIALAVNHQRDQRHEAAFARAIEDPISARLGADGYEVYFAPVRELR